MILGALSHNRKGYSQAPLSTLIILPVNTFEGSFQPSPPLKQSTWITPPQTEIRAFLSSDKIFLCL